MTRLTHKQVHNAVTRRLIFRSGGATGKPGKNSLYSAWIRDTYSERYIVYSYGPHFPLYIWTEGAWFMNQDKYSQTTERHRRAAYPDAAVAPLPTPLMQFVARHGVHVGATRAFNCLSPIAKERVRRIVHGMHPDHDCDVLADPWTLLQVLGGES